MTIRIRGARAHNLKNVNLDLPRGQLTVMTGVSGSGKSSLAFDTLFAEGQRRYVESLSAYARQFLGQLDKPDVDSIEGLSPAISIDQKSTSHNPRSTVGTVTEIYDFLRLMYARLGQPHCPKCLNPIKGQTLDEILDQMEQLPEGTRYLLLAPLVRTRKGEHKELLDEARKDGFARVRINGVVHDLSKEYPLDKKKAHDIDLVVDRLVARPGLRTRLADSVSTALKKGRGTVIVAPTEGEELLFSEHHGCPTCGVSLEEISPRSFSFNSPYGACATCHGLGAKLEVDPYRVINPKKSLKDGAIIPWSKSGNPYFVSLLEGVAKAFKIDLTVPFGALPEAQQALILKGSPDKIWVDQESWYSGKKGYETRFEGVVPHLTRRFQESTSESFRQELETYMTSVPCHVCQGKRLKDTSLAVLIADRSIADVCSLSLRDAQRFIRELPIPERLKPVGDPILKEISARLAFLVDVGLDYLSLDRSANTLSGGEAQRIRLATQIGSGLVGVLYILDEPSIGLHQRDNDRLLKTLVRLRDMGNTLVVVEHDEDTIRAADYLVDIGPFAGQHGGEVVAAGTLDQVMNEPRSLTGDYMSGRKAIPLPVIRRPGNGHQLQLIGATRNNLKNVDVSLPLGCFVSITGVSGSGKSTLINELLGTHLAHQLGSPQAPLPGLRALKGHEAVDKLVNIDQSPIGRTPRSNPATYTGLFDHLREAFALTPEAKTRGYKAGRFSFNIKGGRCEACKGEGTITIEMHFLPDVYVPCEVCHGKRYNRETLEVRYKGKTISDVLDMTVEEALEHFKHLPKAKNKLQTLYDVGLDYIKLGQPATTLSGGEAQRVKLASELSRRSTGRTVYILDEPTTGLHFHDIAKLLEVLQRLVDLGNTVIVIEHNLDVIKVSDHVIDMGPEGGDRGGQVIGQGTPEAIALNEASHTGRFVKRLLHAVQPHEASRTKRAKIDV